MKHPKIIVKDVHKQLPETHRRKMLAANILKIIKANQNKESTALTMKGGCERSSCGL